LELKESDWATNEGSYHPSFADELRQYICALANARGGIILIGALDNKARSPEPGKEQKNLG